MYGAGRSRITHPFATLTRERTPGIPFDLHVLSTPPAFILSQNRTLHKKNAKRHRQMTLKTKIDEHVLKEGRPQKTSPLIKPSRVPDHHDRRSGEE